MPIYFYSARDAYGCFSNFSPHGVELKGSWWPTTEHFFQAQKFAETPYEEAIRNAGTPKQAAEMGRNRSWPLRPDWEHVKDDIMRDAVRQKFRTHADIRAILLGTGAEEIVEHAQHDYYWGSGADGSGLNRLGAILMEIREELRAEMPSRIKQIFDEKFAHWEIWLPEPSEADERPHSISQAGWTINYRYGTENGQRYLEYFSSHRMTNDTLSRIYEDGRTELIGYCQEWYVADNPESKQQYHEHNRAFYNTVKQKGLW